MGNRVLAGTDRALDLLRELPRLSLSNIRSNPKAFKRVAQSSQSQKVKIDKFFIIFALEQTWQRTTWWQKTWSRKQGLRAKAELHEAWI